LGMGEVRRDFFGELRVGLGLRRAYRILHFVDLQNR
jgi:hypothetical protein